MSKKSGCCRLTRHHQGDSPDPAKDLRLSKIESPYPVWLKSRCSRIHHLSGVKDKPSSIARPITCVYSRMNRRMMSCHSRQSMRVPSKGSQECKFRQEAARKQRRISMPQRNAKQRRIEWDWWRHQHASAPPVGA